MSYSKMFMISLCLTATAALAQAQQRTFPVNNYDCQVITSTGARALLTLQANTLEEAESNALGNMASTMLETQEPAVEVTECVAAGDSFSDLSFDSWRNSLPR